MSGSEQVTTIRLPRYLINDIAILPYSEYQARGYEILRDLQNDNIAVNDNYWAHLFFSHKKKSSLLLFITDCYIYRLKKTRTQIMARWRLIEEPTPIHKIIRTSQKALPLRETTRAFSPANLDSTVNQSMSADTSVGTPSAQQKLLKASKRKKSTLTKSVAVEKLVHQLHVIIKRPTRASVSMATTSPSPPQTNGDLKSDDDDEQKLIVQLEDKETIDWIDTKINSAINYVKQ